MQDEHGMSKREIILIMILLLLLGIVGGYYIGRYYTEKNNNATVATISTAPIVSASTNPETSTTPSSTVTSAIDPTAGWLTYTNDAWGLSFKYPSTYTMTKNNLVDPGTVSAGGLVFEDKTRDGNPKFSFTFNIQGAGGCGWSDKNDYSYTAALIDEKVNITNKSSVPESICDETAFDPRVSTFFKIGTGNYDTVDFKNMFRFLFSYEPTSDYQSELDQIINTIKITKPDLYGEKK